MTTIREIADDVSHRLHSFTGLQEQMTYLTGPITSTDTTFTTGHVNRVSEGTIEVDDELMLVDIVQDNVVKLYPFGRGANGSTADSHATNARILNDPLLPRQDVLKAIKETVSGMHPTLFRLNTMELTFNPAVWSYPLPAGVDRVLEVKYDIPGPSQVWPKAKHWKFNQSASLTDFPGGKSLEVYEAITPGFKILVTYAGPFGEVTDYTQTLVDLGIPSTAEEVVILGAAWRLTQMMESSRLQMESVEQFARQQAVQPGSITNFGRQLNAAYQLKLAQERSRLLALTPQSIHFTR